MKKRSRHLSLPATSSAGYKLLIRADPKPHLPALLPPPIPTFVCRSHVDVSCWVLSWLFPSWLCFPPNPRPSLLCAAPWAERHHPSDHFPLWKVVSMWWTATRKEVWETALPMGFPGPWAQEREPKKRFPKGKKPPNRTESLRLERPLRWVQLSTYQYLKQERAPWDSSIRKFNEYRIIHRTSYIQK